MKVLKSDHRGNNWIAWDITSDTYLVANCDNLMTHWYLAFRSSYTFRIQLNKRQRSEIWHVLKQKKDV